MIQELSKRNGSLLLFALVIAFVIGLSLTDCQAAGPWKGQVIDRETKKPIEGAVVLMYWYKERCFMDCIREYHDSEEVVTDAEGRFAISSRWYWSWSVATESPEIYVFRGGYGQWQIQDYGRYTADRYKNMSLMERSAARLTGEDAVLELPKLNTREERIRMLSRYPLRAPATRWPKYLEALNREAVSLGLQPINPL